MQRINQWTLKNKYLYSEYKESMWSRCTNLLDSGYQRYGGSGVSVSPEFRVFEYYFDALTKQKGFHPMLLADENTHQVDKDYLQTELEHKHELRYGMSTCVWATSLFNSSYKQRIAYKYKLTSKRGVEYYALDFEELLSKLDEISAKTGVEARRIRSKIHRKRKGQEIKVLDYTIRVIK